MIALPADLEAAIRAAPDDRAGYAIAGDWLLQHGDLHGELIALALRDEATDGDERRYHLQRDVERALYTDAGLLASWRWGFAWRMRVLTATPDQLRAVLARPAARFLRELAFEMETTDAHLGVLHDEATGALADLRELVVRESLYDYEPPGAAALGSLATVLPALELLDAPLLPAHLTMPRLRELVARAGLDTLHAPALHALCISASSVGELEAMLARVHAPALRRLTVISHATAPWELARISPAIELFDIIDAHAVDPRSFVVDCVGAAGPATLVSESAARYVLHLGDREQVALAHTMGPRAELLEEYLRRGHALFERQRDGSWHLYTAHSSFDVWLNGQLAHDTPLRSGDVITTGHASLRFIQGPA
jgi:hypothetical protein